MDAVEIAADILRLVLDEHRARFALETQAEFLGMDEISDSEGRFLLGFWGVAAGDPLSVKVHVNTSITHIVAESCAGFPELPELTDTGLPTFGVAQFASPVIPHPSNGDDPPIAALSWYLTDMDTRADELRAKAGHGTELGLVVTPWMRTAEIQPAAAPKLGPIFPAAIELYQPGKMDWTSEDLRYTRFLLALGRWTKSLLVTERHKVDRSTQRRWPRQETPPREVSVLKLRKLAHREATHDESGRAYTHQWIVRAHWRQQACGPGLRDRKPILVAPYIKGPPGAPLIEKDRMWEVVR